MQATRSLQSCARNLREMRDGTRRPQPGLSSECHRTSL